MPKPPSSPRNPGRKVPGSSTACDFLNTSGPGREKKNLAMAYEKSVQFRVQSWFGHEELMVKVFSCGLASTINFQDTSGRTRPGKGSNSGLSQKERQKEICMW